jgi:hypothetical protein
MKKTFFALAIILLVSMEMFAQSTAKVYLLRRSVSSGIFESVKTFMDGNLICRLNNRRYSLHEVPAGTHTFTVQNSGEKPKKSAEAEAITIVMEAGKTYYVTTQWERNPWTGMINIYPQEITPNSASVIMGSLKEDTNCLRAAAPVTAKK